MGIFQISLRGLKSSCSLIANTENGFSGVFFVFGVFFSNFEIVLAGHLIGEIFL